MAARKSPTSKPKKVAARRGSTKAAPALEETLELLVAGQREHSKMFLEQRELLRQQGETLRQQGETLRQQGETLRQHGEVLEKHGNMLGELQDTVRGLGVRFERMESDIRFLAEALAGTRESLEAKIHEAEARLSERITILEQVVRQHSSDIRDLKAEVSGVKAEIASLRHDFDHREKLERIEVLERRVAALEARAGLAS